MDKSTLDKDVFNRKLTEIKARVNNYLNAQSYSLHYLKLLSKNHALPYYRYGDPVGVGGEVKENQQQHKLSFIQERPAKKRRKRRRNKSQNCDPRKMDESLDTTREVPGEETNTNKSLDVSLNLPAIRSKSNEKPPLHEIKKSFFRLHPMVASDSKQKLP